MRPPRTYFISLFVITLIGSALACGSFAPPESCTDADFDESVFSKYFTEMVLVNAATGDSGEMDPEQGERFATDDQIAVRLFSLDEVEVRFCIEQRKGGGQIVYDQAHSVSQGENTVVLMAFASDPYVIRVIVDENLIKNLTFFTE
jgi:hypothetical protein